MSGYEIPMNLNSTSNIINPNHQHQQQQQSLPSLFNNQPQPFLQPQPQPQTNILFSPPPGNFGVNNDNSNTNNNNNNNTMGVPIQFSSLDRSYSDSFSLNSQPQHVSQIPFAPSTPSRTHSNPTSSLSSNPTMTASPNHANNDHQATNTALFQTQLPSLSMFPTDETNTNNPRSNENNTEGWFSQFSQEASDPVDHDNSWLESSLFGSAHLNSTSFGLDTSWITSSNNNQPNTDHDDSIWPFNVSNTSNTSNASTTSNVSNVSNGEEQLPSFLSQLISETQQEAQQHSNQKDEGKATGIWSSGDGFQSLFP